MQKENDQANGVAHDYPTKLKVFLFSSTYFCGEKRAIYTYYAGCTCCIC
jgi:hypothetical protein